MKPQSELDADQILRFTYYKSKCQKPQHGALDEDDIIAKQTKTNAQTKKILPGQDGRTRVADTKKWPYSVHGLLSMKFGGNLYTATATMVGPNLAITAAHNLYDSSSNTEVRASDLRFHPAMNGDLLPFGVMNVLAFYYPEEFKTKSEEDYAILILEKVIGHQTGFFGLCALEISEAKNKKINVTGYPADKVAAKPRHHEMWGMEGLISDIDENIISYQIDTYAGQAGGGIWYEEKGEYYVIGVHVRRSQRLNNPKEGTFLNSKRLERIQGWVKSFYSKEKDIQLQSTNSKTSLIENKVTEDPDFCHGSTVTI